MTRYALIITGAALALPFAAAADEHAVHHHPMQMAASTPEVAMTAGTVKKIDKAAGEVVLAHGALDNLGMPAMTMAFRVKDPAWLAQLKPGDRIRFVADYVKGAVMVVRYEPVR